MIGSSSTASSSSKKVEATATVEDVHLCESDDDLIFGGVEISVDCSMEVGGVESAVSGVGEIERDSFIKSLKLRSSNYNMVY